MAFITDARIAAANVLPPLFVSILSFIIWSTHAGLHLRPMLQLGTATSEFDSAVYNRGVWQAVISQALTAMFIVCFLRSLLTNPGSVPDNPEWKVGANSSVSATLLTRELKSSTGDRRVCKWCYKYKPDRCHHCRVCKSCVLKMDHHCPWIMNCVGFGNHKYFYLLAAYATANCIFIIFTILESVERSVVEETSSSDRFFLVLGLVLAIIMGVLMTTFVSFHTWLMLNAMTTIEFCEKSLPKADPANSVKSPSYHCGYYANIKAVLGTHWWLWCLPISPPEGNGISFPLPKTTDDDSQQARLEPEWTGQKDSTP